MDYVEAATVADIAPGTMQRADVGGVKLLIASIDGAFYAMRRNCRGTLVGRIVTCKLHEAAFDVTTGAQVDKPETRQLKMFPREPMCFPVEVDGDKVMVAV